MHNASIPHVLLAQLYVEELLSKVLVGFQNLITALCVVELPSKVLVFRKLSLYQQGFLISLAGAASAGLLKKPELLLVALNLLAMLLIGPKMDEGILGLTSGCGKPERKWCRRTCS